MSARVILAATLVVSVAVVTSFVTTASLISRAYVRRGEQETEQTRSLDVTGSAKTRIKSDLALWTIRAGGEGATTPEAFARLAATTEKVRTFLRERGFPDDSITAGPIGTSTHYRRDKEGRETREVVSQELWRSFSIRTTNPEMVEKAAGEVTELLKTGDSVRSDSPDYVYTKLSDLKIRMIGEATANGRERAEKIAEGSRCRIGAVKDARAGVLQITAPWSTEVSSGGMNDTTTIEKDVTAVVHLTYVIEPSK